MSCSCLHVQFYIDGVVEEYSMTEAHSDLWLVQHKSHLSASGKTFQLEPYRIITNGDTVSALYKRLGISAT